ncbi:hypothetical protein ADK74_21515 [Streptomyces decoyicus]|nr:hypothetical protein ADK74_21515 [Streptomyces decoyicus]
MTLPAPWCRAMRAAMSPIGPQPQDRDGPALRDADVSDGLPRGRENVGEVDVALVRRAVGHFDRESVAEGDA